MHARFIFCVVSALAAIATPSAVNASSTANASSADQPVVLNADAEDIFEAADTVEDIALDKLRGGFRVAGMNISLGADIRTYINGDLVLHTLVNWADVGRTQTQFVSDVLTPSAARLVQASALAGGDLSMTIGGSTVYLANEGKTALAHRTENGLQNILINTANNQNISQTVDATVTLDGYENFNTDIVTNRLAGSLASTMGAVMTAAAATR